jgi:tRNA dimethylallyltransferase
VLGPTATGKTRLGVSLAREFNGEIVSADSRQVFRGMDIGTGKDLDEYGHGSDRVPFHLIDRVEPTEEYHLFQYLSDAREALRGIRDRNRLPVVVGGTTLYIKALLDGYVLEGGGPDPALRRTLEPLSDSDLLRRLEALAPDIHRRIDRTQRKRILRGLEIAMTRDESPARPGTTLEPLLLGPYYPRHETHARIEERLDARLQAGLVQEVQRLHDQQGVTWERMEFLGLEYRYVARFVTGELEYAEMRNQLLAKIRQFCKHQDIWFRRLERDGWTIHWIPEGDAERARALVARFLAGEPLPEPEIRLQSVYYGPKSPGPTERQNPTQEAVP